jgi:3-methyl-2-oxobutanoate hydroxymethyltransferase
MSTETVTLRQLAGMKSDGIPISMLTAYDASFAACIDRAGVDCMLVGDSLGNVIQGRDTTVPVTLAQMVYHVECVRRGAARALLLADLPFLRYADPEMAVASARELMQAGAAMVKLEGAGPIVDSVRRLSDLGVPVCGHLGLTPQSVHQLSGYRVQGRGREAHARLVEQAAELERAGCAMLVLECVPAVLGAEVAAALRIPVIGIGAGPDVDGQVLVLHDLLGIGGARRPRFVRDFVTGAGSIDEGIRAFVDAVRARTFPAPAESYGD